MALQRFVKRTVEREIFTPVIEQAGPDPAKADCRLNWGMAEKPQVAVADVLRAFELGAIRAEELRKMLGKAGWELWERKVLSEQDRK